ncbi:hypothetical protein AHAS_Ahas05G0114100 [Arachis hypogaea]
MDVPKSCVTLLLTHFPEALMQKKKNFAKLSKEIKEMGFNPKKTTFVLAIHVLSGEGNKSIYNCCYEVYKRWGWSTLGGGRKGGQGWNWNGRRGCGGSGRNEENSTNQHTTTIKSENNKSKSELKVEAEAVTEAQEIEAETQAEAQAEVESRSQSKEQN